MAGIPTSIKDLEPVKDMITTRGSLLTKNEISNKDQIGVERIKQQDGIIINISSIAGVRASKLAGAAYSASKFGMVALTHSINEEEMDHCNRASVISPGEVETPILDHRPEAVSAEHRARILQPNDVAAAVLFIAGLPPRACVPELIIKPTSQIYQ